MAIDAMLAVKTTNAEGKAWQAIALLLHIGRVRNGAEFGETTC